ncbi:MAG TPA: peptidylprolyl isomerase [Smithella sp.]|nr:peptidylprolyl isomerase [Smithella sp.]
MTFYKKIFVILGSVMLFCAPAYAEVVDKIVAVVNDEVITLSEFNAAFEPYRKNIENTYKGNDKDAVLKQTKDTLFQRMIDGILIEQEANKTGISATVKDTDVMAVLQDILNKQKLSMQDFLKKLEKDGNSIESVKKEIRSQLVRVRLLRREVKDKILVSDEEIGEYYNKHREEYEGKESVRMKQLLLLVPPGADQSTKLKIKNEALRLRALIMSGESFDLLAAKYSQGPAAPQGGDIGFIEKGTIIPEVEAEAFRLPVDQVSDVIESSLGFHIIKVVDKKGAGLKPIAMVREEIKSKIEDEKLDKKFDEWMSSIRAKSVIETRL